MDDLHAAVLTCLNPAADSTLRERALAYCQDVRSSPDGWAFVLQHMSLSMRPEVIFWCLQVVHELITDPSRYPTTLTADKVVALRTTLLQFLAQVVYPERFATKDMSSITPKFPSFLLNKVAQLIVALIAADYPHVWPGAFQQCVLPLITTPSAANGAPGVTHESVSMFFRLLRTVDEDVTSVRAAQINDTHRITSIRVKDAMRDDCVVKIVDVCIEAIHEPKFASQALDILARYVEWVDISLIAQERILKPVYEAITSASACQWRGAAAAAFRAIVQKRMTPVPKAKFLRSLDVQELLRSIQTDVILANDDGSIDADLNIKSGQVEVAMLVNSISMSALEILKSLRKLKIKGEGIENDDDLIYYLVGVIREALPVALQILDENDDDGMATQTLECVATFVNGVGDTAQSQNISTDNESLSVIGSMLKVVGERGRFPSDMDLIDENSDRGRAFFDLRNALLKRVFSGMSRLFTKPCVEFVQTLYGKATETGDIAGIELALSMLTMLISVASDNAEAQELCVHVLGTPPECMKFSSSLNGTLNGIQIATQTAQEQLLEMVSKGFFDVVGRSVKVLAIRDDGRVLSNLLGVIFDERGLGHLTSESVRSEAAQALVKISKPLRGVMSNRHIEAVLRSAQNYLFPVVSDVKSQQWKNQMLMFETIGYLVGTAQKREGSVQLIYAILKPIVSEMESSSGMNCVAYIASAGFLSKGFGGDLKYVELETDEGDSSGGNGKVVVKNEKGKTLPMEVQKVWLQCTESVLKSSRICLKEGTEVWMSEMRLKVMFFLHCMVATVAHKLVWYLEQYVPELLKWTHGPEELRELISLLCQSTIRYWKAMESTTTKIERTVVEKVKSLSFNIDPHTGMAVSEMDREILDVVRTFVSWVNSIVACGFMDEWWSNTGKRDLLNETMNCVLVSAVGDQMDIRMAPSVMRMSWQMLHDMMVRWGGYDETGQKGFDDLMLSRIPEASVACALQGTPFRSRDYSRPMEITLMGEIVKVQIECVLHYGQMFKDALYKALPLGVSENDRKMYVAELDHVPVNISMDRWVLLGQHFRATHVYNNGPS